MMFTLIIKWCFITHCMTMTIPDLEAQDCYNKGREGAYAALQAGAVDAEVSCVPTIPT